MDRNVNLITDLDGRKIVIINDIRFQSRRAVDWNQVEEYLKEYIGEYFEIMENLNQYILFQIFP